MHARPTNPARERGPTDLKFKLTFIINDLKQLFRIGCGECLFWKGLGERVQFEFVYFSNDLGRLGSFHGALRQVATFVVEQTVGVTAPCNSLH